MYPALILLTRSIRLADEAFAIFLSSMLNPLSGAETSQRILTLLILLDDRGNWENGLGPDGADNLTAYPQLGTMLTAAMEKYGFENALKTLTSIMIQRYALSQSLLSRILTRRIDIHISQLSIIVKSTSLSPSLARHIAEKILESGSRPNADIVLKEACKSLITLLRERHPSIVDSAVIATDHVDTDLIERAGNDVAMLNALSADVSARVDGINALIGPLLVKDAESVPKDELESIASTLVARLSDNSAEVLQALYKTDEHKQAVASLVGLDAVVEALRPAFTASHLDQKLLSLHFDFVCNAFASNEKDAETVFKRLLFPVLLPTDARSLTAETWAIVQRSPLAQRDFLKFTKALDVTKTATTVDLAKALAQALLSSQHFESSLAFLISQIDGATPQLLAHLVLIQAITIAKGEQQLKLAVAVLRKLETILSGPSLADFEVTEPMSSKLLHAISSKPRSSKTQKRATVSLFAALVKVTKPADARINWLSDVEDLFKDFAALTYTWVHTDVLPIQLGKSLLRMLFAQIGEETLLFLASVWTNGSNRSSLRVAALRHATAFVKAYAGSDVDFQLIVPAVLMALHDSETGVREVAAGLPALISQLCSGATHVYALDTIYGDRSSQVQLLKVSDFKRYIDSIASQQSQIAQDPAQVRLLHNSKLGHHSNDGKKDTAHRRAVVGALLSHVAAWQSAPARLALLDTLSGVQDSALFQGVLPLLISATEEEKSWVEGLPAQQQAAYVELSFATLTAQSASVLQNNESKAWKFVLGLLSPSADDATLGSLRTALLARMEAGVFNALFQSYKAEFVEELISSLDAVSTDDSFATKAVLSRLSLDPPTLVTILNSLSQPLETSAHRKRQKQEESGDAERATTAVAQITALIESRNWAHVPGNAPLLASLMGILSSLLSRRQHVKEGIDYLEQETLGAILAVLEKITSVEEINRAHVGIEVIIKVIRASTNPRTSQRALLVAAELARLIPEAVLHNVMPIFTFMGASDFQRDDAYSFGVVQKTVAKIVPVMTRSLRLQAGGDRLKLYTHSKTFLTIFTDMASRLPRHRTLPFFVHLVQHLGAEEFLAPVSMLLVDRATVKSGRGGSSYTQALELPQGVAADFTPDLRLDVVLEVLYEVSRLVTDVSASFLATGENEPERVLRQITALLSFAASLSKTIVGSVVDQSVAEAVVKTLLQLASAVSSSTLSTSGVPAAVQRCLGLSMQLLSAAKFLEVVLALLKGSNDNEKSVALGVFVERLPRVKAEIRTQNAATISEIVKSSAALVTPTSNVVTPALGALFAVANSAQAGEDSSLAATVPVLIAQVPKLGELSDQVSTLSLLEVSARRLVSRVIPFIQPIVEVTLSLPSASALLLRQIYSLQTALLDVVPTFVGSKQLVALLRHALSGGEGARDVISAAARKVPTKTVFPVVMDLWRSLQQSKAAALTSFFDILRLVLRHADKASSPGLIKPIFAFFLDVFDLRHRLGARGVDNEVIDRVENSAIASFLELVTKLSESAFKPLFIRLYDWAVIDLAEGKTIDDERLVERQMVLLHVMKGLLSKFKNLLSAYIGTLYDRIKELLGAFAAGTLRSEPLWSLLLDTLATSFTVDEGAYYTDSIHLELIPLLNSQIGLFPGSETSAELIANALACLAGSTSSENVLRALNTGVCMVTRSDEASTRLAALKVLDSVWTKQAEEMLQFVPETVSEFLAELMEDENGDVELAARAVLSKIEAQTGSLKEYLE